MAVFVVFFLFSGGDGSSSNNDNLRSGQAHHSTVAKEPISPMETTGDPAEMYDPSDPHASSSTLTATETEGVVVIEENLQEAMDEVTEDIKEAEEAQIQEKEQMIEKSSSGIANILRIGMGKLFGSTLTNAEVDQVAGLVEGQLVTEATEMLRHQADDITNREIDNLEGMVNDEEEAGVGTNEIEEDVYEQEPGAVGAIKVDIDAAAISVNDKLKARATEIEKAILEERLSAKLGKRVKLVIVDDEIAGVEGSDELFHGLNTLAPPGSAAAATPTRAKTPLATSSAQAYGTNSPHSTSAAAAPPITTTYGTAPKSSYNSPPYGSSTAAAVSNPSTASSRYGTGSVASNPNGLTTSAYGAPKAPPTTSSTHAKANPDSYGISLTSNESSKNHANDVTKETVPNVKGKKRGHDGDDW